MSKADVTLMEFLQDMRSFGRMGKKIILKDQWSSIKLMVTKKGFTQEEALSLAYLSFELYKLARGIEE